MQSTLEGKTAVVTGGTQGIGGAITSLFLEHGANVCAFYHRDEMAAKQLHDSVGASRDRLQTLRVDVSDYHAVSSAFDTLRARWGAANILVNNAAVHCPITAFERQDNRTWSEVFSINVLGVVFATKLAIPPMKEARWGRIINISSMAATDGLPNGSPYAASKASLLGLTRSLAKEVAPYAITVNALLPGMTETRMANVLPRDAYDRLLSTIPIGRIADSKEVASLVAFLAGGSASYISGSLIPVSGGR
ncbi:MULTISPECIES: SDR family NAD(P)-dependent oxidoreductase [Bradyrhizobium]|uniref:SDR family oxidoreductase n=1 Tax=Bradyrhizobium elkanii TaxID=29448 RepID=A0A4U6RJ48_BRAEL|nr:MULTISPECIES: SDR family NAD(P)-dependent oxidoreductase [Bradyrhizobium]MTV19124.1 SDR family oxidoreductase [Bradyrhizobium sp. BR2003]TKV74053.1 SDR family oxidoreductase [Bradyrhizobium elkanii]